MKIKNNISSVRLVAVIVIAVSLLGSFAPYLVKADQPIILRVVPQGKKDLNCGNDWENGCDLQYALTMRTNSPTGIQWEIWVKQGTYIPTIYIPTRYPSDRLATFQMKSNVSLYGGFLGTEETREQRDWVNYPSILSGDIDQNDQASSASHVNQIVGNNSYHVVTFDRLYQNIAFDGFVVTAGKADGSEQNHMGGGFYLSSTGSPEIRNTTITGNFASSGGGGFYTYLSSPAINNILFTGNEATWTGGGMYNEGGSPLISNSTYQYNSAQFGGALLNDRSSPKILNSLFYKNSGSIRGGAIYSNNISNLTFENVTITENTAGAAGGIMNDTGAVVLRNVTMLGNIGSAGNEEMYVWGSTVTVNNSIIWSNSEHQDFVLPEAPSAITATNSIIRQPAGTTYPGEGNINANPLVGGLSDEGGFTKVFPLLTGSPAINSGSNIDCPGTDQRGVQRLQGSICDIGAYEALMLYKNFLPRAAR